MKKLITIIAILFSLQSWGQVKVVKDTVVINSTIDLNWIKINGELYQIKKVTTIEKAPYIPIIDGIPITEFNKNMIPIGSTNLITVDSKGNIIKQ